MSEDIPFIRRKCRGKASRGSYVDPFEASYGRNKSQYEIARLKIEEDLAKHNRTLTDFGFEPNTE